jgi:hypothetical protein
VSRPVATCLWVLVFAGAIHLDWHLARPAHHGPLSGGLAAHWLLAVPVFGLLVGWLARQPAATRFRSGVLAVGGGVLGGQLLEPLWEKLDSGLPWGEIIPDTRWSAFAEFMFAGLVIAAVLVWGMVRAAGRDREAA